MLGEIGSTEITTQTHTYKNFFCARFASQALKLGDSSEKIGQTILTYLLVVVKTTIWQ